MRNGLRFFLISRLETVSGSNSLTITPMGTVREFLEIDEKCSFIIVVHEDFCDKKWLLNYGIQEKDLTRIRLVAINRELLGDPVARRLGYLLPPQLFKILKPDSVHARFIDTVIVDGIPQMIPLVKVCLTSTFSQGYKRNIPVVLQGTWIPANTWTENVYGEFDCKAAMLGTLYANRLYWESKQVEKDYLAMYREVFKANYVSEIINKAKIMETGLRIDKLVLKDPKPKGKKPVILWSGHPSQDFQLVKKSLIKLVIMGKVGKVLFHFMTLSSKSSLSDSDLSELKSISNVEVHWEMPQLEYFKFIQQADIAVGFASKDAQYGSRFGDMVCQGILLVVNDIYARIFLEEGYPFVFNSEKELFDILSAAIKYLEKDPNYPIEIAKEVRKRHDVKTVKQRMYEDLLELRNKSILEMKTGDLNNAVVKSLADKSEISHSDFIERLEKNVRTTTSLKKNAIMPPGILRWLVLAQNYVDVGTFDEPYYTKSV